MIFSNNILFFILFNIFIFGGAIYLYTRKNLLTYFKAGNLWLTWLAIGIITLMDELTSIFYAPSEALRHIGLAAIIFIPITSLLIRFLSTRMVQIAEILDLHKLKGGGVYNFSYLVMGPLISFVAVASILIDYILTAAISTVSAVENATYFLELSPITKLVIELGVIWGIAGLNIIGIRENLKVTFTIFLITAVVLLNLLVAGLFNFDASNLSRLTEAGTYSFHHLKGNGFFGGYFFFIAAVSNCILAYSGVESVLQTAKLSESWKISKKAYSFLALSVGVFTPILSILVLSSTNIDFASHPDDLITHFASQLNGNWFGVVVCVIASITLIMALNTACVASSELIERVAHRYGFEWIVKTNSKASLYRIHIINAFFFSLIVLITQGQIPILADMYAVGLVAGFTINLLALLLHLYKRGVKESSTYKVSRLGTFLLFIVIGSCFIYLSVHKPFGFLMWAIGTLFCLLVGVFGMRKRAPEIKQIAQGELPMDVVLYLAEGQSENVHIYFKRPNDSQQKKVYDVSAFITLYSPRQPIPARLGDNHFRIPFKRADIIDNIIAILDLISYELPQHNVTVHLGWPTSSWFDRLSTGVVVFQLMGLPAQFPKINFKIEKFKT